MPAVRGARACIGERSIRTANCFRILDAGGGAVTAVRLNILTRTTRGGLETDLRGRMLGEWGDLFSG